MASGIIHYAITDELIRRREFKNPERLKLGSVLVDYCAGKGNSHLKIPVAGGHKRTYDFEKFRSVYGDLMKTDDLYLGYYLHLVQDILFRHFVFDRYDWNPTIPGNNEKLHRDYEIGNAYVIRKYNISNTLEIPADFESEPINRISSFDLQSLKASWDAFFAPVDDENIFFFTKKMTDEFISEAVRYCMEEIDNLSRGSEGADSYSLAWDNFPKSLFETTRNTRDLGGYRIYGTKDSTKYNRIYRSDLAKSPSDKDINFLKGNGITTVIDLRIPWEVERSRNGLGNIEGISYYNIPIEEGSGIPSSVEEVPYSYQRIAESPSMSRVMRTIADAPEGVIFNCSAGKDRSGVTAALLLWLVGVSRKDIIYDYMITKVTNRERFELVKINFPDVDINIVIPDEKYMDIFLGLMKEKYGTAADFFSSMGLSEEEQLRIIEKLTK